jgi:fructosamine-3-kinase
MGATQAMGATDPLVAWLQQQLGLTLIRRTPVAGGCIHTAWCLEFAEGARLFAKSGDPSALPLLEAEADGLAALARAAAGNPCVPRPHLLGRCQDQVLLLLDWLALAPGRDASGWRDLGIALARLHRRSLEGPCAEGDRCDGVWGWPRDNAIGSMPQLNGWWDGWSEFFVQRRLAPQLTWLARRSGALRGAERLLEQAGPWLQFHTPEPVLVHGDLWSGNAALLVGGGGALFDPSIHRADREVDLAMAQLFGGFPASFFAGYEAEWPLPAGHRRRRRLYNLYHLLNHANLFGGSYRSQAQHCLDDLLAHPPNG